MDLKYDQNRFRNETDLKTTNMIVIEDSFVEGSATPLAQLTTSLLAHIQGKVVANLGQSGYGPQQELVVLKQDGLPLRSRTVTWMFFFEGNDLTDVVLYDNLMHKLAIIWSSFFERSFTKYSLRGVKHFFPGAPKKPAGAKRSGVIQAPNGKELTIYCIDPSRPLSEEDLRALDETVHIIATTDALWEAQGARLVFVFVPDKFSVFHSFCQIRNESECRKWVLNDLPGRLRKTLGSVSSDIGYLDLTPALVDAVKRGAVPYYSDDEHWSPEGHKLAAETINGYLSSMEGQ